MSMAQPQPVKAELSYLFDSSEFVVAVALVHSTSSLRCRSIWHWDCSFARTFLRLFLTCVVLPFMLPLCRSISLLYVIYLSLCHIGMNGPQSALALRMMPPPRSPRYGSGAWSSLLAGRPRSTRPLNTPAITQRPATTCSAISFTPCTVQYSYASRKRSRRLSGDCMRASNPRLVAPSSARAPRGGRGTVPCRRRSRRSCRCTPLSRQWPGVCRRRPLWRTSSTLMDARRLAHKIKGAGQHCYRSCDSKRSSGGWQP